MEELKLSEDSELFEQDLRRDIFKVIAFFFSLELSMIAYLKANDFNYPPSLALLPLALLNIGNILYLVYLIPLRKHLLIDSEEEKDCCSY